MYCIIVIVECRIIITSIIHTTLNGAQNGANGRVPTDKRTHMHTDATKRIIAPATRSIKITVHGR